MSSERKATRIKLLEQRLFACSMALHEERHRVSVLQDAVNELGAELKVEQNKNRERRWYRRFRRWLNRW